MIKLVVFDMAGTTINEHNVVYKTLHSVINQNGYTFTLNQVLEQGAGKEKKQAIADTLSLHNKPVKPEETDALYAQFLAALNDAYLHMEVTPMPGTEELFAYLRSKKIGIVLNTGYNRPTAELLLAKLNWQQGIHFDHLITASDVPRSRPFPDMIWLAMQYHQLTNPLNVTKIGDSTVDIEEGIQAGCGLTIGITTGAHTRLQLLQAKPTAVIDHLSELMNMM
ncbi:MAG TPA: phosphonatase-like hydrolase [Chitinophagales bacterium]|nr:phosphonatase-like hydrolase [Chitinophagales bacterium]